MGNGITWPAWIEAAHTSEADIDRWRAFIEKRGEIGWRTPHVGRIEEPVAGLNHMGTPVGGRRKDVPAESIEERDWLSSYEALLVRGRKSESFLAPFRYGTAEQKRAEDGEKAVARL